VNSLGVSMRCFKCDFQLKKYFQENKKRDEISGFIH
jgi:hypothetical protein